MTIESYTIYDLGYNQSLSKIDNFYDEISRVANIVENEVNPISIASGYMSGNYDLVAGHIESSNFVSGSTGWQITADGDVEFNTGTFRGTLEAGSIHIPDQTTADSFHTETDGDSYWGCNVADWASDNNNAKAWIKKDGTAKFQEIFLVGDASHKLEWDKTNLTLESGIITGGTIQTATSGQRVRVIADAGSTPTQLANSCALIDTSNNILMSFGSSGAAIQEITPATNIDGLTIINKSGTNYTSDLLYLKIVESGSTGECLDIENAGTGHCIKLENTGTGGHLEFIPKATFTSALSEGLCYADTDHHLKYYNGSGWINITEENTDGCLVPLIAGETISNGQTVIVAKSTTGHSSLKQYYNDTADLNFGKASGNYDKVGQYFLADDLDIANTSGLWVSGISVRLKKIGTPTDNVKVSIQADVGSAPSGTPLGSGTIDGSTLTTSYVTYDIDIDFVALTAGLGYNIVVERTGDGSDVNYYASSIGVNGYANGNAERLPVGGGWSGTINDMNFDLRQHFIEGKVYIASAVATKNLDTFFGFAAETITGDTSGNFSVAGGTTPLQGNLTVGITYYLSDTFGAISTSPGTNTKKVGFSLSTTQLQILNTV